MNWWRRVRNRWRLEAELDAELRFHLDRLIAEYIAAGLSTREARRRALEDFGPLEGAKDACRDARGTRWVHDLSQDLRFAARLLLKDRAFTVFAVLALGLGIGVNNTLFTIVNAMCLRGLPIEGAERVIDVGVRDATPRVQPLSRGDFERIRAASAVVLGAYVSRPAILRDDSTAAERVLAAYISAGALAIAGRQPLLGRGIAPEDDQAESPSVVVLGAQIWRNRYGASPAIVGQAIRVNGTMTTVVGVMSEGLKFPDNADIWQPLASLHLPPEAPLGGVFGRLAPGMTLAQARDGLMAQLPGGWSLTGGGARSLLVRPIAERYRGNIMDPAWLAFITAGLLVVVIAASNVASLLLARAMRRAREMRVRVALGASRGRIVRQLLVEAALLAAIAGVLATGISALLLRLLLAAIPAGGLPHWVTLAMDARVFGVLAAVCLGTAFLCGLGPAVHLSHAPLTGTSLERGGIEDGVGARRWTGAFVAAQIALTVILVSCVGISVHDVLALNQPSAVDVEHVLTFRLASIAEADRAPDRRSAVVRELRREFVESAHAVAVSAATALPGQGIARRAIVVAGASSGSAPTQVMAESVDADYFTALRVGMVSGRGFERVDADDRTAVIVDQRFVDLFLPNANPIGWQISLTRADATGTAAETRTIVGIVPSLAPRRVRQPEPRVYLPLTTASPAPILLVRAAGPPGALASEVRDTIRRLAPDLAVYSMMTLADALWTARWNARVSAELILTLAVVALGLATFGLSALTACAVTQRARELGIRLALGATRSDVMRLVLGRAAGQIAWGLALGSAGAVAWARLFATPALAASGNLVTVMLFVAAITLAAAAWPARKASRVDPMLSLRAD